MPEESRMPRHNDLDHAVALELGSWEWPQLRIIDRDAAHVPDALRDLLQCETADEAEAAYWRIENSVVVQGQVFSAAPATVSTLVAALSSGTLPRWVTISALELIFWMVNSGPHEGEAADLTERCCAAAREGLWLFYRLMAGDHRDAAR